MRLMWVLPTAGVTTACLLNCVFDLIYVLLGLFDVRVCREKIVLISCLFG